MHNFALANLQEYFAYAKANWWIYAPFLLGWVSAMSCNKADFAWSDKLKRPSFDPPKWVWFVFCNGLYLAIGYAMNLIWTNPKAWQAPAFQPAVAFFIISLATNLLWAPIFMHFRKMLAASIMSVVSVVTGALATYYAHSINETSGQLMAAYTGFYAYATTISYSMYLKNKPRKLRIGKKD